MIVENEQMEMFSNGAKEYLINSFSADNVCDQTYRRKLESHFADKLIITDRFNRQSVSYQLSKKDMLHRWLKYKEGFSADLVNLLLDEMQVKQGDTVMDPFLGSGTTALVCQLRGINSIGYDIMPISDVALKAKADCMAYDIGELKSLLCEIENLNIPDDYNKEPNFVTITKGAYPEENAHFIAYLSEWNDYCNYSDLAKNLLKLCIINSLENCSYTWKSGQYLTWDSRAPKIQEINAKRALDGKKPYPEKHIRDIQDAKTTIIEELKNVIHDIEIIQANSKDIDSAATITFRRNSVLFEIPKLPDDILNGVITSPPYCNRYDYTRTYALELAYLGINDKQIKKMRQDLLSCTVESKSKVEVLKSFYSSIGESERFENIIDCINKNQAFQEILSSIRCRKERGDLNNNGVLRMVEGYFTELAFIYAELYRLCKKGATVVFVNDNVRYGGEVIPVDFLSSSFAEQFGFSVKEIYTLKQQKGNSSQQMAKFGRIPLRKSLTVWVKE